MTRFRRQTQPEESPSPRNHQGLTTSQRRALNSTLVHLERHLLNLEQRTQADGQGILILRSGQLAPTTRQRLLDLFEQLRQEITTLATEYALPGVEEDVRATLVGTASILWSDLEDIRPSRLTRYGAVDPTLEATLGPSIERLIQGVLSIEAIAKSDEEGEP